MSADESSPMTDFVAHLQASAERREQEAAAAHAAWQQVLRAEGIAGTIRVSVVGGGLYAHGPDLHGSVTLFAMADGTVRWKKEGQ